MKLLLQIDGRKNDECKITGYLIKLQMISQTSYSEVKTNDYGFVFGNIQIIPGQRYAVMIISDCNFNIG